MAVETPKDSAFIRDASNAGVDGVLVVDYPPEECVDFAARLRVRDMDLIFLLAPTSTDQRMQQVAQVASGYVYYVSLKGVTGSGALDIDAVSGMLPRIRQHVSVRSAWVSAFGMQQRPKPSAELPTLW
jgi:tryptophan synthase alpha chain